MKKSYTTGTYIMRARKEWECLYCKRKIDLCDLYFNRIQEFGEIKINQNGEEYRHVNCRRYHISCAKENLELSKIELDLFDEYKDKLNPNERGLQRLILDFLNYAEKKNRLFYTKNYTGKMKSLHNNKTYNLGRRGFPDLSIFLNNNIVLFVELKTINKKISKDQEIFKRKITNLNYKYFVITSLLQLKELINHYI